MNELNGTGIFHSAPEQGDRGIYTAGTVNSASLLKVGRKSVDDFPPHF